MDKEQKFVLKELHEFCSNNYKKASEAYLNNYLTSEDIELYINNEQSISQRINALRELLKNNELKEKYNSIANGELPADEFLTKLKSDLGILETEYHKLLNTDSYTSEQAKQKLEKIKTLEKRIDHYNKLISDLEQAKEEYIPKRKPGRPKKKK